MGCAATRRAWRSVYGKEGDVKDVVFSDIFQID